MRKQPWLAALLLSLSACGHSGAAARAGLAARGQIDSSAPFITAQQVTINAPPDKIWALLTNIPGWPVWHNHITQTSAAAAAQAGSPFSWSTQGMTIHSTIDLFTPGQALAFTGDVLNFHAILVWTLTSAPNNGTRVTLQESVDGFLISHFYSQNELTQTDQSWLQDLKTTAESQGPGGPI